MKSLEIVINGKKVCVAGVKTENRVAADVYFVQNSKTPCVFVSGDSYNEDKTWKERYIFGQQELKLGDEVIIKVIESDKPDQPIETHEIAISEKSEELTNQIIKTTAKLYLDYLLSGKPIPIKGNEGKTREEVVKLDEYYCSFCGKHKDEVGKLISGPDVFICNECIGICVDILNGEIKTEDTEPEREPVKARWPSKNGENKV